MQLDVGNEPTLFAAELEQMTGVNNIFSLFA